uniref:Ornithine aminotransferase n=1 Tax=Photinus pyralis TaxID=7054 RepID=A0A1Y1L787_PHOPY
MRALEVVDEEKLVERAERLGNILREGLKAIQARNPIIQTVRGRGLLNAFVIDQSRTNRCLGIELCERMKEKGLLLKSSRTGVIRIAPPLVVTEDELEKGLEIIKECVEELSGLSSTG